jgi:hypothetical protein
MLQQSRRLLAPNNSIARFDGRVAAQLLIERITGWPDFNGILVSYAHWLQRNGDGAALSEAGIRGDAAGVLYEADSPKAARLGLSAAQRTSRCHLAMTD